MHNNPKPMGHNKGTPEREVYSNTGLPTRDKTFQINNLTLHLQEFKKTKTKTLQSKQKEGNNQDQTRIK